MITGRIEKSCNGINVIFCGYDSKKAPGWSVDVLIPMKKDITETEAQQFLDFMLKKATPFELDLLLNKYDTGLETLKNLMR